MMLEKKDYAKNIGVIILAAGSSTRLGRPKQLLIYNGKTLLQHILQVAVDSIGHPVVVVLGAYAESIKENMPFPAADIVENTIWHDGMASSIRCGILELVRKYPFAEGAVLMLCDQPYVTTSLINDLVLAHQNTGGLIVASSYNDTIGAPAFFHKSIFPELLQLNGDVGARFLIKKHAHDVEVVYFSKGETDIDTEADYEQFSKGNHQV